MSSGADVPVGDGRGVTVAGCVVAVKNGVAVVCVPSVWEFVSTVYKDIHPDRRVTIINQIKKLDNRNFIIFLIGWLKEGRLITTLHLFTY